MSLVNSRVTGPRLPPCPDSLSMMWPRDRDLSKERMASWVSDQIKTFDWVGATDGGVLRGVVGYANRDGSFTESLGAAAGCLFSLRGRLLSLREVSEFSLERLQDLVSLGPGPKLPEIVRGISLKGLKEMSVVLARLNSSPARMEVRPWADWIDPLRDLLLGGTSGGTDYGGQDVDALVKYIVSSETLLCGHTGEVVGIGSSSCFAELKGVLRFLQNLERFLRSSRQGNPLSNRNVSCIPILVDASSCISVLQHYPHEKAWDICFDVWEKADLLHQEFGISFKFFWCPSHSGQLFNAKADEIVGKCLDRFKEGEALANRKSYGMPFASVVASLHQIAKRFWQPEVLQEELGSARTPVLKHSLESKTCTIDIAKSHRLSLTMAWVLLRIRTETLPYGFTLYGITAQNECHRTCPKCKNPRHRQSVRHLIFECNGPGMEARRNRIFGEALIEGPAIVKFLDENPIAVLRFVAESNVLMATTSSQLLKDIEDHESGRVPDDSSLDAATLRLVREQLEADLGGEVDLDEDVRDPAGDVDRTGMGRELDDDE